MEKVSIEMLGHDSKHLFVDCLEALNSTTFTFAQGRCTSRSKKQVLLMLVWKSMFCVEECKKERGEERKGEERRREEKRTKKRNVNV